MILRHPHLFSDSFASLVERMGMDGVMCSVDEAPLDGEEKASVVISTPLRGEETYEVAITPYTKRAILAYLALQKFVSVASARIKSNYTFLWNEYSPYASVIVVGQKSVAPALLIFGAPPTGDGFCRIAVYRELWCERKEKSKDITTFRAKLEDLDEVFREAADFVDFRKDIPPAVRYLPPGLRLLQPTFMTLQSLLGRTNCGNDISFKLIPLPVYGYSPADYVPFPPSLTPTSFLPLRAWWGVTVNSPYIHPPISFALQNLLIEATISPDFRFPVAAVDSLGSTIELLPQCSHTQQVPPHHRLIQPSTRLEYLAGAGVVIFLTAVVVGGLLKAAAEDGNLLEEVQRKFSVGVGQLCIGDGKFIPCKISVTGVVEKQKAFSAFFTLVGEKLYFSHQPLPIGSSVATTSSAPLAEKVLFTVPVRKWLENPNLFLQASVFADFAAHG